MKLTELEPEFLKLSDDRGFRIVESIAEADGIWFLCPKCFEELKSNVGCHHVICWRPRVPADLDPKPGRWEFQGSGYSDLTFKNPGASSVLLTSGCKAHFNLVNGEIQAKPDWS